MNRGVRLIAAVVFALEALALAQAPTGPAQNPSPGGWRTPDWNKPPVTAANRKPAPRRNLTGMWGPADGALAGTQQQGIPLKPNDGKPEHALPYTPYGLQLYKSHHALEGFDGVLPTQDNDPRNRCEPLGVPRANHYNLRLTQIFQDSDKVLIAYEYDNRWRVIWTDGRQLPKVVAAGVDVGGEIREPRFYGYSVGRWLDDDTFQAETVGTMPDDRVWLDSTGRPISEQAHVTETFHRTDADTLVWSETIDDPKIYTQPVETMRMPMRLHDPRTDMQEYYCSPFEQDNYNTLFGSGASSKGAR